MNLRQLPPFRGLNLRDQPDRLAPGQALDGLNFDVSMHGELRRRIGSQFLALAPNPVAAVHSYPSTATDRRIIVAENSGSMRAFDESGTQTHLWTTTHNKPFRTSARASATGSPRLYLGSQNGIIYYDVAAGFHLFFVEIINLLDGSVSSGREAPLAPIIGYWPGEERLLAGGFVGSVDGPGGLQSFPDQVFISQPNRPDQWAETSFVRVGVGDGSLITGIVAWRDQVFVFKRDRYFVFTNTGTDARGVTTFSRRNVETGVGAVNPRAVAVGDDGVYFVSERGLHRTRGGDPDTLSELTAPLWDNDYYAFSYYTGGKIAADLNDKITLAVADRRIYMGFVSDASFDFSVDRLLVYDIDSEQSMLWSTEAQQIVGHRFPDGRAVVMVGRGAVYYTTPVADADIKGVFADRPNLGRSIPFRYKTAYDDLRGGRVTRIVRHAMWGAGHMEFGIAADFAAEPAVWRTVTFPADGSEGARPKPLWIPGASRAANASVELRSLPPTGWSDSLNTGFYAPGGIQPSPTVKVNVSRVIQHVSGDPARNAHTMTGERS